MAAAAPVKTQVALEDLFADEDKNGKSLAGGLSLAEMSDLSNPLIMITFYRRLFPFKQLFLWLNQEQTPTKQFTHREFSYTLEGEVYVRYKSFANAEEMKKDVVAHNPTRFEIGPVYTGRPKDKKALLKTAFRPVSRELVFDIDMTDYDSIRTCCKDKAMCKRCWKFIALAVKVLDKALRHDFGFKHLLWVYSGRRGIHCWVSDPAALALTDSQRGAIVNYLEVIKGEKKMNLMRPLHPMLQESYDDVLKNGFGNVVLMDQECLKQEPQWEAVLALIPDKAHAQRLLKEFADKPKLSSIDRWKAVVDYKNPRSKGQPGYEASHRKFQEALQDIIIQFTYPRIDTEVSKKQNHLLKSPFCVHPGTGRVCVPLLPSEIDKFDPDTVPTVGQLLLELEAAARAGDDKAGWERTSLKPYIELFERHVEGILKDARGEKRDAGSMEF